MTAENYLLVTLQLRLSHVVATFYMVGLVWFVQHVRIPLFAGVGSQQFPPTQSSTLPEPARWSDCRC